MGDNFDSKNNFSAFSNVDLNTPLGCFLKGHQQEKVNQLNAQLKETKDMLDTVKELSQPQQTDSTSSLIREKIITTTDANVEALIALNSDTKQKIDSIPDFETFIESKNKIQINYVDVDKKVNYIIQEFFQDFNKGLDECLTSTAGLSEMTIGFRMPNFRKEDTFDYAVIENFIAHNRAANTIKDILVKKGYKNFTVKYSEIVTQTYPNTIYSPQYNFTIDLKPRKKS